MKSETGKWIKKAKRDLKTAEYNFKGDKLDAAAFYSQQAAEKALKALEIERLGRFDKIHDLIRLAKTLNAGIPVVELCDKISPAYFVSRYPDIEEKYSKKEVKEIIDASKEVLKWVAKELK